MPSSDLGFVAEDLDLVIRWYGAKVYKFDQRGRFMLCELKCADRPAAIGYSKEFTFGYLHQCLALADPILSEEPRYRGFFTITTKDEDWDNTNEFYVNATKLDKPAFISWLRCDEGTWDLIESRTFKNPWDGS